MNKLKFWLVVSWGLLMLAAPVQGGTWSGNQFIYKPAIGARGAQEKALYDTGMDRVDTRLGNEIWVNDPKCGGTLQGAIAAVGVNKATLRLPPGTWTISDGLAIPANITLKPERGAVLSVTIPDVAIQGLSRAAPGVVTWTGHGLNTGDKVSIKGITQSGWKYLNGGVFPITKTDNDHFTIGVDTSNSSFYPSAYISDANGKISKVLDIRGGVDAGEYQVFNAVPGKVAVAQGVLKPEWWGAVPDGVSDCAAALQSTFYALPLDSAGQIKFSNGTYYLASAVDLRGIVTTWNYYQCIIKLMGDNSVLYTDQPITMLGRQPENDWFANLLAYASYVVDGVVFRGTQNRRQIGLDLQCTYNSKISNCGFDHLGIGLRLIYAMMPEVSNCMANQCSLAAYDCGDGRNYWPTSSGAYPTNTGILRNCRSYNYFGATPVNIGGLSSANPCVVTWNNHGLNNGEVIYIRGITQGSPSNWQSLNNRRFKVLNAATNSFTLTQMDGTTTFNTSTWPAYTPDSNGKYVAWCGAFRLVDASGITLDNCISEGGNPVDNVYIDTLHLGQTTLFRIKDLHQENTPIGGGLYARWGGGLMDLSGFGAGNGTVSLDAYDTPAGTYGLLHIFDYIGGTGKIRMPADNPDNHLTWDFEYAGTTLQGLNLTDPNYWYGGVAAFTLQNKQAGSYGRQVEGGDFYFQPGEGFWIRQDPFMYASGQWGYYKGLRSESIYRSDPNGGGIGCYDSNNSQASMLRLKAQEISITANGSNTQTISYFIPAGTMVIGFTARVTQAIGGATSLSVGESGIPNEWINAMGVTLNSTANLAQATAAAPRIYPIASHVNLTANGGNFNGTGKVRLTCHYIYLEPPSN